MPDSDTQSGPAPAMPASPAPGPANPWRLLLPLLLVMLTLSAYLWQRHQSADSGPFGNALSRQSEVAARVDSAAQRAARGERAAFARLRRLRTRAATAQSDTRAALAASRELSAEPGFTPALDDIDAAWRSIYLVMEKLLGLETATSTLRADVETFQSIATGILVTTDELVDALVAAGESPEQIRTASRQLLLIQRISANVRRVLEGGDGIITAADRFGRDAVLFGEINIALLNGDPRLGVERVRAQPARDALVDIGREFRRGTELIEQIMADALAMAEALEAAAKIGEASARVNSRVAALQRRVARLSSERPPGPVLTEVFGLLAVVSLLVVMAHMAAARRRARVAAQAQAALAAQRESERSDHERRLKSREQATEDAVRRLIDELDRLARGEAPGDPQLRESLFDTPVAPVEAAVAGLRHRLRALTRAAARLAKAGAEFSSTARGAGSAADDQGKQVEQAASATRRMAAHVEAVSEQSRKAARIGSEAHSGETFTAARTTAARVRQLNESTRQIEEVGRLVDELSEQCRMLSLNVSIRASLTEGSADTGAARFAEEIKKLADHARRAMRRIESANENVRTHAGQASDSVKQLMWSAEKFAARNEEAGKRIANAAVLAQRVDMLNRQLVEAIEEHTRLMTEVVKSTTSVHGVAARARREFREVAANASRLSELAGLLETTVSGFESAADKQRSVIALRPSWPVEGAVPAEDAHTGAAKGATGKD
jgi:twitching motility protein PilJ